MQIFCPSCGRFLGQRNECQTCGWQRSPAPAQAGRVCWTLPGKSQDLSVRLLPFPARFSVVDRLVLIPTDQGEVWAVDVETGQVRWQRAIQAGMTRRTPGLATWQNLLLIGAENLSDLPSRSCELLAWEIETGQDAWALPVSGDSLSPPVVDGDTAYFTSSEPRLYALHLPGRQLLWSVPVRGWAPEPAALRDDLIVAPARGPTVAAFDRQDGRCIWTFSADDPQMELLNQRPAISSDFAFLCGWGKRLYALDRRSGKLAWRYEAERGLTSPPVLAGDTLLVGEKGYRAGASTRQPGYRLTALSATRGEVIWTFPTGRHIYTVPVVADGLILFGADDSILHVLSLESGQELWQVTAAERLRSGPAICGDRVIAGQADGGLVCVQWKEAPEAPPDPEALLAAGRLLEAAEALALAGRYMEAAKLYARKDRLEYAALLFLEADLPGQAKELYLRLNQPEKALAICRQVGDRAGEAQILAVQGNLNGAAEVYAEIGQVDLAVEAYRSAGQPADAANLLLSVGRHKEAADLFRAMNEHDRAAEALIADGSYQEAAEVYRSIGEIALAAGLLARAGKPGEAAALNEQTGNLVMAAAQYAEAGQVDQALRLYESQADWNAVVELAGRCGDLERKALALAQLGQREQAAAEYARAGNLRAALDLYEALGWYEQAAELAGQLADWDRQAQIFINQGLLVQAAEAYLRRAKQIEPAHPQATALLTELYETARKCFLEAGSSERAAECQDLLCRLNQWPNLTGKIVFEERLVEDEFIIARLVIHNTGYSAARNITVQKISQNFSLDTGSSLVGLRVLGPRQENRLLFTVKPGQDVIGQVTLKITLQYGDPGGRSFTSVISQAVRVLGRDEKYQEGNLTPFPEELRFSAPAGIDLVRIYQGLVRQFDLEDLRQMCFELQIDFDNIRGETKSAKARELIRWMVHHNQVHQLLAKCREMRPEGSW